MDTKHEDEQVLVFELSPQRYALPIASVREVLPLATLTQLPQAPVELAGILRLRGTLLPIIDLRHCLRLPRINPAVGHRIIVTLVHGARFGFQVDAVHDLLGTTRATQRSGGQVRHHAVERVFSTPDGVVMLLDLESSISSELREYIESTTFSAAPLTHVGATS